MDVLSAGVAHEHVELAVQQALHRGLITSVSLIKQATKHSRAMYYRFQKILSRENNG